MTRLGIGSQRTVELFNDGGRFLAIGMFTHFVGHRGLRENETFPLVERMARARHPLRDWVIGMYRAGSLISSAEGAVIASVPRQTVARWIREAGIDVKAARLRYLARSQAKAGRYAANKPPRGKPTKAFLRRIAGRAVREFNARQTKPQ